MDVNSGSIHVVDDVVYDLIPLVEALVGEGVKEINAVKAALRERESISWPEDILEEALRAPATAESTMEMLTGSLQRKHPSKNTATIARKVINSILIKIPPWLLWWRDRDSPVPLLYLRLT